MLPEITLGSIRIPTYYLMMFCGFLSMGVLMQNRKGSFGSTTLKTVLFTVALMAAGLAGCKLLYILENWRDTLENGLTLGGFSFFGAVFFIPPLMVPVGLLLGLKPLRTLDACAPCVCSMLAIVRVGCFLNGCCGGWEARLGSLAFRWPTQAMESVCDFMILTWLLGAEERGKGNLYGRFLVSYGVVRFFIEFLRDTPKDWLIFSHGQVFAMISALTGCAFLRKSGKRLGKGEEAC